MINVAEKIQELVETKDFNELAPVEKEIVYTQYTEEEYTQMRMTVVQYTSLFEHEAEHVQPRLETIHSLRQQLIAKPTKQAKIVKLLTYQLPVYKAAAIAAVMLFGLYLLLPNKSTEIHYVTEKVPVYQTVIDTVFVEREPEVKTVYLTQYKQASPIKLDELPENVTNENVVMQKAELPQKSEVEKSFGNSSLNKTDLDQFWAGM